MNEKGRHRDSKLGGSDSDDMLRRRFAVLRREEEQQAPEFGRLWQAGAGARRRQTVASITEWKAPTDFLLETPGSELLRTVPEIGQWHFYSAMPGAMPSPAGKKLLP